MANVWKIGTRWSDWGDPSASVLSIMRRNNVAFVWLNEHDKSKFLNNVKKGDFIALADGYQIVAWIDRNPARPSIKPATLQKMGFNRTNEEWIYPVIIDPHEAKEKFIELSNSIIEFST